MELLIRDVGRHAEASSAPSTVSRSCVKILLFSTRTPALMEILGDGFQRSWK
jgi:hypothetical protein